MFSSHILKGTADSSEDQAGLFCWSLTPSQYSALAINNAMGGFGLPSS